MKKGKRKVPTKVVVAKRRLRTIREGIRRVREGSSIRRAAKEVELSHATLARYVHEYEGAPLEKVKIGKVGHPLLIDEAAEKVVASKVVQRQAEGLGLTFFDVQDIARTILVLRKMYTKEQVATVATRGWAKGFMARHGLSLVQGESYGGNRAGALNEATRKVFLDRLAAIKFEDIPPRRIWNMDETAMGYTRRVIKHMAPEGSRTSKVRPVYPVRFDLIYAANADASVTIPPTILSNGTKTNLDAVHTAHRLSIEYFNAPKGKVRGNLFLEWVQEVFLPNIGPSSTATPHVLLLDNASAHTTEEARLALNAAHVQLVFFPPRTTAEMQPLDIAYFSSLKDHFVRALSRWKSKHGSCKKELRLTAAETVELIKEAIQATPAGVCLPSGFRKAGLVPFDPAKMVPAVVIAPPEFRGEPDDDGEPDWEEAARMATDTPDEVEAQEGEKRGRPPTHLLHTGRVSEADLARMEAAATAYAKAAPVRERKRAMKSEREWLHSDRGARRPQKRTRRGTSHPACYACYQSLTLGMRACAAKGPAVAQAEDSDTDSSIADDIAQTNVASSITTRHGRNVRFHFPQ